MPTATILAPLSGDVVCSPVSVVAGYSTTATFNLAGCVGGTCESPQSHGPPSGVHTSAGIAVAPGTYTVEAKTGSTTLHSESGVVVTDCGPGPAPPIEIEDIGMGLQRHKGKVKGRKTERRAKTKRKVKGRCNATASPPADYVICRVYEVDTLTHNRALITAGAGSVIPSGSRRKWTAEVEFTMDTVDHTLQYIARVTAYDKEGNALGVTTKHILK